jgi:hypothetical protein
MPSSFTLVKIIQTHRTVIFTMCDFMTKTETIFLFTTETLTETLGLNLKLKLGLKLYDWN